MDLVLWLYINLFYSSRALENYAYIYDEIKALAHAGLYVYVTKYNSTCNIQISEIA
jgi:hypothetical protein